jgi:hypothetical protein
MVLAERILQCNYTYTPASSGVRKICLIMCVDFWINKRKQTVTIRNYLENDNTCGKSALEVKRVLNLSLQIVSLAFVALPCVWQVTLGTAAETRVCLHIKRQVKVSHLSTNKMAT